MKQRYEERIAELEEERNAAEQEQERIQLELSRAVDVGRRLQAQLSQAGVPASPQQVQTEVPAVNLIWLIGVTLNNALDYHTKIICFGSTG